MLPHQEAGSRGIAMVVLVTGAAGFIGSHVVGLLLAEGKTVRGTVRRMTDANFLHELPQHERAALEIVEMDLLDSSAVHQAVNGCDTIVHCAATLMVDVKDAKRDVVDPSVIGTTHLCEAILENKSIHTVIHTSSVAAIRTTNYDNGHTFTSDDWCDDASIQSNPYGFAKAEAERIMRKCIDGCSQQSRQIRLITIHPSIVFGPVFHERHTSGSMAYLKHFSGRLPFVLNMHINFVDVRDVAKAHVAALHQGEDGSRYLLHSKGLWMNEIGRSLRRIRPGKKWAIARLPTLLAYVTAAFHPKLKVSQLRSSLGRQVHFDCRNMEDALGLKLHDWNETLGDSIDSLAELGRKV